MTQQQPPASRPPTAWAQPQVQSQAQAQPAWGPPPVPVRPPLPNYPHPAPREYHQMLLTWNYAWWKPVVGILLVLVGMLLVAPFALLPVLAVGVALEGGPFWQNFEQAAALEEIGPAALLYLNLTLGATILVTWFVMRVLHRMRPRWLGSVMPKLRWKFLFICIALSLVALIAQIVVGLFLPGSSEVDGSQKLNDFTTTTALLAVIVLLTTPFQAAGEEYVFRGYLLQAVGSFFGDRRASQIGKWLAILITSVIFAMAHGVQNVPLFFDRFMFGLIAGWLVTRTGGLEAGIAMHVLNNFLAFGVALSFGDLTASMTVSEVSWWNIVLTLTQSGVYAVLVLWLAKKMRLETRTRPPMSVSSAEATYTGVVQPSGA